MGYELVITKCVFEICPFFICSDICYCYLTKDTKLLDLTSKKDCYDNSIPSNCPLIEYSNDGVLIKTTISNNLKKCNIK